MTRDDYSPIERLSNYPYKPREMPNLDVDYDSGARIVEASSNDFPDGVLGLYDPTTHTIKIKNTLSGNVKTDVLAHESGHAQGIKDEKKTDDYQASKTGRYIRGFGKWPLAA
jgi:hypothetical protein